MLLWGKKRRERRDYVWITFIVVLFALSSIANGMQFKFTQMIYIDDRNYPGGPWQYFLDTQSQAIDVIFLATLFLITFLCDTLVVSARRTGR